MGAIVCELCGSNDVVKQDGFFVCQHCGTKYSLEEAKKMLGTVQIDNSNFVEKYLQNARRAKEKEDWEETEKYYNMVEQNDPDNIEAIFYSAYGKAKASLTSDDIYKRQAIFNSLQKSISIIDDHYDISKEEELRPIITQISSDIINLCCSDFVYTSQYSDGQKVSDNSNLTYALFIDLNNEFCRTIMNIIDKFPDSQKKDLGYLYQIIINHNLLIANGGNPYTQVSKSYELKRNALAEAERIHRLWASYDPSHTVPDMAEQRQAVNTSEAKDQHEAGREGRALLMALGVMAFIIIGVFTGGIS